MKLGPSLEPLDWLGALGAVLLCSGCEPPPASPPDIAVDAGPAPARGALVRDPVSISYESHGCYGPCPIYRVTIRSDGSADYVGRDHVRVSGERRLRLTPDSFRRFAAYLAPIKPPRGSIPSAGVACNVNDGPTWSVQGLGADGARPGLCVGSHDQLPDPNLAYERIRKAPDLLPIEGLVGPG